MQDFTTTLDQQLEAIDAQLKAGSDTASMVTQTYLNVYPYLQEIDKIFHRLEPAGAEKCIQTLERLADEQPIGIVSLMNSFLLKVTGREEYLRQIFMIAELPELQFVSKHFLYWQITRAMFIYPELKTTRNDVRLRWLYSEVLNQFRQHLKGPLSWVPSDDRNSDLVIIMTSQFTSYSHAPTQLTINYAWSLREKFGKNVIIVNTADQSRSIAIPYYDPYLATHVDRYNDMQTCVHEGHSFPFHQPSNVVSNWADTESILSLVATQKPLFILSIGGSNLIADLCADMVPVATLPLSFDIPVTEGTFAILPRTLTNVDEVVLSATNRTADTVLQTQPAYSPPREGEKLTREQFGIPRDAFTIVVAGNRLDDDCTSVFMDEINELLERNEDIFLVFVGKFKSYTDFTASRHALRTQSTFIGYQTNLASVYEICDAFLNPPRLGGGTSAAWALGKGLHVFTYVGGDVGYTVGESFHIANFVEVEMFARQWKKNEAFRVKHQQRALERAAELYSLEHAVQSLLYQVEGSPLFKEPMKR